MISIPEFLTTAPRYPFFTGKGGVGKTSLACVSAVLLADKGRLGADIVNRGDEGHGTKGKTNAPDCLKMKESGLCGGEAGGYDEHGRHAAFDPDSARRLCCCRDRRRAFVSGRGNGL